MKIDLHWMNENSPITGGTTFGMPWSKGVLDRETALYMAGSGGSRIPMQHEPRAFWPDGSVKWTLHNAVLPEKNCGFTISDEQEAESADAAQRVAVTEDAETIHVDTGAIVCTIAKESSPLIKSITRPDGRILCSGGRLVALNEQRHQTNGYTGIKTVEEFQGKAFYCVVEQSGPLRAVVRLRGSHTGQVSGMRTTSKFRKWLTFDLRLYFFAGQPDIRMVHTFIFDGREEEDYLCGLGMEFDVPMTSSLFNRYVRFGGDDGLFSESPKSLWVRQKREYDRFYEDQLDGKEVLFDAQTMLNDMTEWNDFKILQHSSEDYTVYKRTGEGCVYVKGPSGSRAMGIAYAGGSKNGLAVFMKDFWQKYPSSFEARGMLKDTATVTAWFWSPDAAPMDMRRYDNKTHVDACYEGFEEMRSSAYGVVNTNEIVLQCFDAFPGNDALIEKAQQWQNRNLLLAPPEYYVSTDVFGGVYNVCDRSTPERAMVEDQLDALFDFYKLEREQSRWYGFWDYGDIRHAYDAIRHSWRYDMGGFAWQNTELVPNLWLWFSFLRTQREDYFRFAEAMLRHNSEVDLYHLGDYKLLGSRHNVVHWGCGCKEGRIGLCLLHKVYYYLTGDERIGDIMDEEKDVDYAIAGTDPLRAYFTPDPRYPAHIRFGPDIIVICENWFTRWERFEDTAYRDKLMEMLGHFRAEGDFAAASIWGYDPKNGSMTLVERKTGVHFNFVFGTVYIMMEILAALDDDVLRKNLLDMGQIHRKGFAEKEAWCAKWGIPADGFQRLGVFHSGVCAVAARYREDSELAAQVWETLLQKSPKNPGGFRIPIELHEVSSPRVHKNFMEAGYITGNDASQWGSNTIVALAMIGDKIPENC